MILDTISWEVFINVRIDSRGVKCKFEDLCRQLFANDFLKDNKEIRFLHSNPNNPGLESDPIFDETCKRWIGYQAKFFENNIDYADILDSACKTVQYYGNNVDCVYLYCNKPLSTRAQNFIKAVSILKNSNIKLELITDNAILDQVRKYPYLANYYFNRHTVTHDWLVHHTEQVLSTLGERFNANFNVNTNSSLYLSLFVHDEVALKHLNGKKEYLKETINKFIQETGKYKDYLKKLQIAVESITDVTKFNLTDALNWEILIRSDIQDEIDSLITRKSVLESELNQLTSSIEEIKKLNKTNFENNNKKRDDIQTEIIKIEKLLSLPDYVSISKYEQCLLTQKVLIVKGRVGIGKTQLLSNETVTLINAGRNALLLNAGMYYTDNPIQEQIMNNCFLNYSLDDMVDILEAMGEQKGEIVPILIDALNETSNKSLWENSLENIIRKIESTDYVKIIISYRSEYEKLILSQSVLDRLYRDDFSCIIHNGFVDNSIEAAKRFFDFYHIPLTPFEYFSYEITNPLFLTLYCKTYEGDEVSLPVLYDRLLKHANRNIHRSMKIALQRLGYSGTEDLLTPFVEELTNYYIENDCRSITKKELIGFQYWKDTGIACAPFVSQLKQENIIYDNAYRTGEYLFFAYDHMNDYFCANAIMSKAKSKDEIKRYIIDKILKIRNKRMQGYSNQDVFINICALYAERYGEECIEIIDKLNNEMNERRELFGKYINSYQWRKRESVSAKELTRLLRKYGARPDEVWGMLISNSMKIGHPLNADFLHQQLSKYQLNKRDEIWTKYINSLFSEEGNRLSQLIEAYNRGENLTIKNEKQIELLLTLFGWLLTSSDRYLRDYTSKAMIEILKYHFSFCEKLLEKFKDVNDPYVLQRLYGIVFGSCCKRLTLQKDVYQSLAEFVYTNVFNKDKVYPDILLRDYARLVIERFLWEFNDYDGSINKDKIKPPYKSDKIPHVKENYDKKEYHNGLYEIQQSMRFANMGYYGDFGRYVFQRALGDFEVDLDKIYNYAMSFIINVLCYSEKLSFTDKTMGFYNRYTTKKVERIGKKYQWIAMYNILARVSDNCKMINPYSFENEEISYEGTWEPYVRDFDPTLNNNFMYCPNAPHFKQIEDYITTAQDDNETVVLDSKENKKEWLRTEGVFLTTAKDNLVLSDDDAVQWVSLTKYSCTGRKNMEKTKLYVWSWTHAFFVTVKQEEDLRKAFKKGIELLSEGFTEFHETYEAYNREYPWSPSCKKLREYSWKNIQIKTGEKETVTETQPTVQFLDLPEENMKDGLPIRFGEKIVTYKKDIKKDIGKVLYATTDMIWEEEYDATKDETISRRVPCAELIDTLKLRQKQFDGFYFDEDGKLAAFDTSLNGQKWGLVIRKDLLDKFLKKTGMKLIWFLKGAKEVHNNELYLESSSDWSALFIYGKDQINSCVRKEKEWL